MDNSASFSSPIGSQPSMVVKKKNFLTKKTTPLLAAVGLMVLLVLGAAGLVLSQMQSTTDTRSQASASKTAQLIMETSELPDKQVTTVYLDGSQLPKGTKVNRFLVKLRLIKIYGDPQAQVLGDSIEIIGDDVSQLAADIVTCGGTVCPAGYACVTLPYSPPRCLKLTQSSPSPYPSPVLVSPKPSVSPSAKPSPTPPPTGTVLGTYESLTVESLTKLFKFNSPQFKLESVTPGGVITGGPQVMPGMQYLTVTVSGTVNSAALGRLGYAQLLAKVPLFTITNALTTSSFIKYNFSLETQSIKGFRPGSSALVELTSPAPSPSIRPSPTPPSPAPSPVVPTGGECQRCAPDSSGQEACNPGLVCKEIEMPLSCPPGSACMTALIPTPTCVKPDGSSPCMNIPTPVPSPTPPACPASLSTYDFVESCGTGYRYIKYTCSDGFSSSMGGITSCKPKELWISYAKSACQERMTACVGEPTPMPSPVPSSPRPRSTPQPSATPIPSPMPAQ